MSSVSITRTTYELAGLRIDSELPLPWLTVCLDEEASAAETVFIRRARVPETLPGAATSPEGQFDGHDLLVTIRNVARFLIRGGNEILVDPMPDSEHRELCAFLLGTAFGALCHQRGIIPLHACAIDVPDGCVAFTGASGAGKSTLAAALVQRGHQVISDDVCFLRQDRDDGIQVWPGVGRIRLWQDATEALGYDSLAFERQRQGFNKFLLPIPSPSAASASRRLRRLYQLKAAKPGEEPSIVKLNGAAAIELIMPNIYRLKLAELLGRRQPIFAFCAAIASQLPIYRFRRPLGFDILPGVMDQLEDHLRDAR